MKTRKQVLADFYGMQKQLMDLGDGIVEVRTYVDGPYWSVRVERLTFNEYNGIASRDYVEWTHYSVQDEQDEQDCMHAVKEFKETFNLK